MEANWVLRRARTWAASVPVAALAGVGSKEEFDAELEKYVASSGLTDQDGIDLVALVAAQEFLDGSLSFEEADQLVNLLWIRITDDLVQNGTDSPMPELAYSIYDAFDAGEYDHGDGKDPVATYTIPTLKDVMTRLGA